MKTKFIINDEIFGKGLLSECFEYYETNYSYLGFILDKESQDVYIILDKEIQINEGDRVELYGSIRIVTWKCIDVINDIIQYSLEEE